MKNYKKILLKPTSTVKEAFKIIDTGAMQIALVVDENEKLLGTLTDGDIRRGILEGLSLESSIKSIIFTTPTVCKIDDTKEKILEVAFAKKLHQLPIINNEGRVVGIEEVDALLQPQTQTNRVILMVGGLGTRLRPLTEETPKPMLKVGNKPILETIIGNFKKYGFVNIVLCVGYKAQVIKDYFQDGTEFGVNIEYIYENKRMGTAGALSLLREKLDEDFFVMNGDLLTNINFKNMLQHHLQNHSKATMGVREYEYQVPYGVVNIEDENIVSIEEKPLHKFFVNGGIYVLSSDVLEFIPDDTFYDMPTLFEKLIETKMQTLSFPICEYWLDIGRIEEFQKANEEFYEVFDV